MKHLDLFSGIGGFALATDRVYGKVEHIFCDNNPFCQQVLKKHWPTSKIYGDIKTLTYADYWGQEKQEQQTAGNQQCDRTIDLLTGGFPCQPFSQAGLRKGTADNRYLWPEMLRIIRDFKPKWVIAENVRGLLTLQGGVVFEQVCVNLETSGYEVQSFIIPACAINAPHRRDRIWIVAHSKNEYCKWPKSERNSFGVPQKKIGNRNSYAENPISKRSGRGMENNGQVLVSQSAEVKNARPDWETDWIEVATRFCGVDDGLPVELDGFKLTKAGHRTERLKSLGNSIVPQIAEEIIKAIDLC